MANEEYSVDSIQLTALVKALKEDLQNYHKQQLESGLQPLFSVNEARVEAEVMASAKKDKEGGIDLKIVRFGTSAAKTSGVVFRLSLSLSPLPGRKERFMGTQKRKKSLL